MSSPLPRASPHKSFAALSALSSPLSPSLPFANEDKLSSPFVIPAPPALRLSDTDWLAVPSARASPVRIACDLAYEPFPETIYVIPTSPDSPTRTSEFEISVRTRRGLEYSSSTYTFETDTADDNIVLFTRQPSTLSRLGGFTHVHDGADFLDHFKKTLPKFLDNHSTFYDDISTSVRSRLSRAVRPSEHAEPIPALGHHITIPYLSHLVTCIIQYHRGSELVSNFSWRCSDYILIVDVVPKALLRRYIDSPEAVKAGDIFTKYNGGSDPMEELDDDELADIFTGGSDPIEEVDDNKVPALLPGFEIEEIDSY
ncbi:hypothetical protein BD410DRAFT_845117 [Rickenella mellea]|uniref:Uncharacterized protein n=1 Tax=Rickenella mellea TaxID=50990 RepID=A0A4Y7PM87_9AGAM|nr:hypothetical protein BD410DRAFT_845117 [Rickenella mellea]